MAGNAGQLGNPPDNSRQMIDSSQSRRRSLSGSAVEFAVRQVSGLSHRNSFGTESQTVWGFAYHFLQEPYTASQRVSNGKFTSWEGGRGV